jgi:hypothetical protein
MSLWVCSGLTEKLIVKLASMNPNVGHVTGRLKSNNCILARDSAKFFHRYGILRTFIWHYKRSTFVTFIWLPLVALLKIDKLYFKAMAEWLTHHSRDLDDWVKGNL